MAGYLPGVGKILVLIVCVKTKQTANKMETDLAFMTIVSKASQVVKLPTETISILLSSPTTAPLAVACFLQALPHTHTLSNGL